MFVVGNHDFKARREVNPGKSLFLEPEAARDSEVQLREPAMSERIPVCFLSDRRTRDRTSSAEQTL